MLLITTDDINNVRQKGVVILDLMDEKRERHSFSTLEEAKTWLGGRETIFAGAYFASAIYLLPFDTHMPTLSECLSRAGLPLKLTEGMAHNILDVVEARMCLVTDLENNKVYSIADDNVINLVTGKRMILLRDEQGHGLICDFVTFSNRFSSIGC